MKRTIPAIFSLLLLAAAAKAQSNYLTWSTNADETLTITSYTGPGDAALTIPDTINGLTVTEIAAYAFAGGGFPVNSGANFSSVTIPDTVINIGEEAFYACFNLTNAVVLGDQAVTLGESAFNDCTSLVLIAIPNLIFVPDYAFQDCSSLGNVTIPSGVTNIGNYAFQGCISLSNITIPSSVISIGTGVFQDCSGLTKFTLPSELALVPDYMFDGCSNLTNLVTPSTVTVLGDYAFYKSGLTNISIPNSVSSIGAYDFYESSLTNLVLSSQVTNVGPWAFANGQQLTNVTILGTANIGSNAFYNCNNLGSVYMAGGVIGYGAFDDCGTYGVPRGLVPLTGLSNVVLGNGVTSIGPWAFSGALISNINLPDSLTNIGDYAFYCPLQSIVIPGGVAEIGTGAFEECPLTNATFSYGLQSIGGFAFYGTALRSVTFPDSLTYVGSSAFYACGDLASNIIIPASVTQMAAAAFAYDPATNMLFLGNAPTVIGDQGSPLLNYGSTNATVYYLPGTSGWGATYGGDFANQTALWNPTIQAAGVSNRQFGFNITGTSNIPIVVEACTNLANPVWVPLQSMTLTNGSVYFSDPNWSNYPARYYGIGFP